MAPASEGEADGSHECHRRDEIPESEEVRLPGQWWELGGQGHGAGGWGGLSHSPAGAAGT